MAEVTIETRKNGPYRVTGPVRIVDYEGNVFEITDQAWLCRCGGSAKKPFCDGTHKRIGFVADNLAPRAE
ncbi:MAG TPA: CDGSH iron-sulfur domain-containing protein [Chloroflexota bacterium]